MKMTRILIPVMTPLALAISSVASAGPAGYAPPPPPPTQEFKIRIGGSYWSPNSDNVTFADRWLRFYDDDDYDDDYHRFRDWGAFRTNLDPDGEWGWFINAEWKPIDHWSVSLSYQQGDRHTGGSRDPWLYRFWDDDWDDDILFDRRRRGDFARWKPQTTAAYLNWYPLDPSCLVQPYIGIGINYTDFSDERLRHWGFWHRNDDDDLVFRDWDGRVNFGDSWGYTWQIGVDFTFGHDSSWLINLAAIYYDVTTDVEVDTFYRNFRDDDDDFGRFWEHRFGGDYEFDPWVFQIGVGYKFDFNW
ncbi:OmpW/AlkL family protein [Microbulbifer variabilis]|uniref:Outer membrane beta-barrel protein n=1 Tax=Microbulbifer variabilis TaxID=266805 RepID=A0ABY4VFY2_9GAMM|nr:OmpW family outer membrane protein [Microbulbifer variabilis]USD22910.1 outer membrane beta-barrel protein [Microbulbifer variabilis]